MTAAERILEGHRRRELGIGGTWATTDDIVECALDYYEACRLLMEVVCGDWNGEPEDAIAAAETFLATHGLEDANSALLWDKLPKEER